MGHFFVLRITGNNLVYAKGLSEANVTIAMCYVLQEGIVLGADSTTSINQGEFHYYNNNQKLFEIGEESTLGMLTWGLGSLLNVSHRTLFASLADDLKRTSASSVKEVAERWINLFYTSYILDQYMTVFSSLHAKSAYDSNDADARTEKEEALYKAFTTALVVGFCLAGRYGMDRTPYAYQIIFDPLGGKPVAEQIPMGLYRFWGAPNIADRLIYGYDASIREAIVGSSFWSGSQTDFDTLLCKYRLSILSSQFGTLWISSIPASKARSRL